MTKIICTTRAVTQKARPKSKTIFLTENIIDNNVKEVKQIERDRNLYNFKYLGKNKSNQLRIEIDNFLSIPIEFGPKQEICEVVLDGNTKCD